MTLKTPARGPEDPLGALLGFATNGKIEDPIEHAPGVIEINHWNPEMLGYQIAKGYDPEHWERLQALRICEFGVVDSPTQFLARFGSTLEEAPTDYAVFMVHVRKDTQDPRGGWRWHKWGEYVGEGEPTTEYLYDEPGFPDGVYTFHVYEVAG